MRRSSGRSWIPSVAAAVLLAVMTSPVAAGEPGGTVIGGGDDPNVAIEQSAADGAVTRWKVQQAARLRAASEHASKGRTHNSGGTPQPDLVPPPGGADCPPVTFVLDSRAR